MPETPSLSLAGQTLQWRFDGGPTGDKTYEHTFGADGTVTYREVGDDANRGVEKEGERDAGTRYESFEVAPGMHLVSYLAGSGYTLTVLVDRNEKRVHGFASNDRSWFPLRGVLLPAR